MKRSLRQFAAFFVLAAMMLPGLPALAAPSAPDLTVSSELDAALAMAPLMLEGQRSFTVRSSVKLDGNLLYTYLKMLFPDYFTMSSGSYNQGSYRQYQFTMALESENQHRDAVAEAQRVVDSLVTEGMTQREKLLALHDYLVNYCAYDMDSAKNQGHTRTNVAFTPYGALVRGLAVCDGYSEAFMLLCAAAGVPCIYVGSDQMNHSWNAVYVDGSVYYIDVTYDDPVGAGDQLLHTYFMLTAEDMRIQKHVWEEKQVETLLDALWRDPYYVYADTLNQLGLFRGTDKGYELARQPTRQESLVMLLRLLGEEQDALAYTGPTAFTDLGGWAEGERMVSYAKEKGYTNGVSQTTFAPNQPASTADYLCYLMRALGYREEDGDFTWKTALDDAMSHGLFTAQDLKQFERTGFNRGVMAFLSVKALKTQINHGGLWLCDILVERGAINHKLVVKLLK